MEFRPCIDIHNGKVKQIVGGSLIDKGDQATENFVADYDGAFYANLYKDLGLKGGHIILLNPASSEYYEATKAQAMLALSAYPGGLQIGGGINPSNAADFIEAGASHVIVTSYVFSGGIINWERLKEMLDSVGREHLVLDLSCRKRNGEYYVVTDRWQKFTDTVINADFLNKMAAYCDEILLHAVDVEGKASGIDGELVKLLAGCEKVPVTYAGGVGSYEDLVKLKTLGNNKVNVTIGSALDLFGGSLEFDKVLEICRE